MKILHLGKYYPPYFGGIETVTFNLVEGLNNLSINCDVLCAHTDKHTIVEKNNYTVYRAGIIGHWFSTPFSYKLVTTLSKIKDNYDIIHVHLPNPMAALAVFLTRPKAKIVLHWHSDVIKQKYLLKLYLPLQYWLLNRADLIVGATSKYVDESSQLRNVRDKTLVVSYGIDVNLDVDQMLYQKIKNRYNNKQIIFALGRLVYYKGFQYLIQAAQNLPEGCVVLIGGLGNEIDKLTKLINELGLSDKVFLLGKLSDPEVKAYFKSCDVFCLPSCAKSEAFGVVMVEAMAFGKPIISTDIYGSGVSWVNPNGVTGLNVPIKNATAIADALKTILLDKVLYQKMSHNCIDRYNQNFTTEHMINGFTQLYSSL